MLACGVPWLPGPLSRRLGGRSPDCRAGGLGPSRARVEVSRPARPQPGEADTPAQSRTPTDSEPRSFENRLHAPRVHGNPVAAPPLPALMLNVLLGPLASRLGPKPEHHDRPGAGGCPWFKQDLHPRPSWERRPSRARARTPLGRACSLRREPGVSQPHGVSLRSRLIDRAGRVTADRSPPIEGGRERSKAAGGEERSERSSSGQPYGATSSRPERSSGQGAVRVDCSADRSDRSALIGDCHSCQLRPSRVSAIIRASGTRRSSSSTGAHRPITGCTSRISRP